MNSLTTKTANNLSEAKNQFGTANVVQSQEMTKAMAEVQARVVIAKQFPRDVIMAEQKIKTACERPSLASVAEYEYPRGNTKVVGATIKLLEVVAQNYGNIQSGWDCMVRDMENHISHCKAFAWDIENNNYYELKFDVPHVREKKGGNEIITNPRDIYEMESNQASRRVRKCLETVVPRDIVEQARDWCNETLTSKFDIQKGIDDALKFFKETYGVTYKQVEKYFGISRAGFNKNQYLSLRKIATSLKDGLATVEEIFPNEEAKEQSIAEEEIKKENKVDAETGELKQEKQEGFDLFGAFSK